MKNSENQITVLGGSLGIIIMLLAISNYLNMMSESIQNRSKEFAILESIGMTRKQIKKMIVFESLGYSIFSIVIALIIGLPASYLVFTNFNIYRIPYVFPVIKTLLLFLTIIIVCVVTSLFVFLNRKVKQLLNCYGKMKFKNIDSCGMLLSAIHNVNGEEKLNLVMLDDAIPAGAKLY